MKNLTDIKARMKSVAETRQITGAMETISVAKMRKAMARFESNRAYFDVLKSTIADIAVHSGDVSSKYLRRNQSGNAVYIVIASDKGLAGGFNHNVLNFAYEAISKTDKRASVFCVGQMAREFLESRNVPVDVEFTTAAYDPTMRDAREIGRSVRNLYDSRAADEVYVVYTRMLSGANMYPEMIKILPLDREFFQPQGRQTEADEKYFRELAFDPSPEEVMEELIPQYLTGMIYGALIQSAASEHSSRREAMNNATSNADEILEDLGIEYHRARQEAVTNELSEIITAAMGVNHEKNK